MITLIGSVVHVPEDVALIINTGSRGFYRIRYCPETLGRVTDLLLDDHLVNIIIKKSFYIQ